MRISPLIVLVSLSWVAPSLQAGDTRTVEIESCQFSITIPKDWAVEQTDWDFGTSADCSVGLRPPSWVDAAARSEMDVSKYAIYVGTRKGDPRVNCEYFVCREGTAWYVEGRAGARWPAQESHTSHWTKIRGVSEVGAYRKGGGYLSSAQAFVALLFKDGRVLEVIADREFQDEATFDSIVDSVCFNRSQNK
mgnify:FL=1